MSALPRVLYVDDDAAVSRAFVRSMSGVPVQVVCASGVGDAHTVMQSTKFDVVASDFTMPDGTGIDVLTQAVTLQPHAAFMIISGDPSVDEQLAGMPVDFVIAKPWDVQALRANVLAAVALSAKRGAPDVADGT